MDISKLREKRFYSQLSIHELGRMTGIDPSKISLIERGYKIPREDEIEKFANALDCLACELFPEVANG